MPLPNRVDPFGDLHAVTARGMLTGNRGCLVDGEGRFVRHHRGSLWISCLTEYRGWRHPLTAPRRWTPLFFLDDAVALAAGHRPCGLCRREAYRAYRDAAGLAIDSRVVLSALDLNRLLKSERLRRGRGIDRAAHRLTWRAAVDTLPTGTVVLDENKRPHLVVDRSLAAFAFDGWQAPTSRSNWPPRVEVLTPPLSVGALAHGFTPTLTPTLRLGRKRHTGLVQRQHV